MPTETKLILFYFQISHSASGPIWIGATDEAAEGHWKDTNGQALTFFKWYGGNFFSAKEPNNKGGKEHCGVTKWDGRPGWNDVSCSSSKVNSYACEYGK